MPLWNLIPPAIAGAKAVYGLLNQPKKGDFENKYAIEAYQNKMTEMQNNIEGKSLAHSMARPQIRQSAINRERSKQGIEQKLATGRLSEGQAQQAQMSADTSINREVTDVLDRANKCKSNKTNKTEEQLMMLDYRLVN